MHQGQGFRKIPALQGFEKKEAKPGGSNSICLSFGVKAVQMQTQVTALRMCIVRQC